MALSREVPKPLRTHESGFHMKRHPAWRIMVLKTCAGRSSIARPVAANGSRSGSRRLGSTHPLRRKTEWSLKLARVLKSQRLRQAPKQDDRAPQPAPTMSPSPSRLLHSRTPQLRSRSHRPRLGPRADVFHCDLSRKMILYFVRIDRTHGSSRKYRLRTCAVLVRSEAWIAKGERGTTPPSIRSNSCACSLILGTLTRKHLGANRSELQLARRMNCARKHITRRRTNRPHVQNESLFHAET